MEEATKIFKGMYQVVPSNYGCWSPKVLRLIDCQATVKSVKASRGRNALSDLRDEHGDVETRLLELYQSTSRGLFEANNEVSGLIDKLEFLTTQIVEVERSRGGCH